MPFALPVPLLSKAAVFLPRGWEGVAEPEEKGARSSVLDPHPAAGDCAETEQTSLIRVIGYFVNAACSSVAYIGPQGSLWFSGLQWQGSGYHPSTAKDNTNKQSQRVS